VAAAVQTALASAELKADLERIAAANADPSNEDPTYRSVDQIQQPLVGEQPKAGRTLEDAILRLPPRSRGWRP
jgi:hypothetical protein